MHLRGWVLLIGAIERSVQNHQRGVVSQGADLDNKAGVGGHDPAASSSTSPVVLCCLKVSEAMLDIQLKLWFETSPFLTK